MQFLLLSKSKKLVGNILKFKIFNFILLIFTFIIFIRKLINKITLIITTFYIIFFLIRRMTLIMKIYKF